MYIIIWKKQVFWGKFKIAQMFYVKETTDYTDYTDCLARSSRNQVIDYQPRMHTNEHEFWQSTEYTEETESLADGPTTFLRISWWNKTLIANEINGSVCSAVRHASRKR